MVTACVLAAALAHGAPAADALLNDGDRAWWARAPAAARRAYRSALRVAKREEDPAGEAMARLRLMRLGSNLAPLVHEPPLDRALQRCPPTEPRCALAAADRELLYPAFAGADPARVASILEGRDDPPALARLALAGDPAAARALAARANDAPLDGMGQGVVGSPELPPPGRIRVGIGVSGAPGLGVGGAFAYRDGDLGGHQVGVSLSGSSRGAARIDVGWRGPGDVAPRAQATASRGVIDRWSGDERQAFALDQVVIAPAVDATVGPLRAQVGLDARVERLGEAEVVVGPTLGLRVGAARESMRFAVDSSFGDYAHVRIDAVWTRVVDGVAGGWLPLRVATAIVATPTSPWWRWPSLGGAEVLRGVDAGRFRSRAVASAQGEWRRRIVGPLIGAVFVDTGWADGPHVSGGAGVRLDLSPDPRAPDPDLVTRLDVGVSPDGWGVVVAIGEAF